MVRSNGQDVPRCTFCGGLLRLVDESIEMWQCEGCGRAVTGGDMI